MTNVNDKIKSLSFPNVFETSDIDLYFTVVDMIDWNNNSTGLKPYGRISNALSDLTVNEEKYYDASKNLLLINQWIAGQFERGRI